MKTLLINCLSLALLLGVASCDSKKSSQKAESKPSTALTPATKTEAAKPAPKADELPEFKFESTEFAFGKVKQGAVVKHVFKFKNVGKSPLVIQNIGTSCGCTTPSYSKEPIAPGATGEVTVKFDTKGKRNQQSKSIRITANTQPSLTTLRLTGYVDAGPDLSDGPVRQ